MNIIIGNKVRYNRPSNKYVLSIKTYEILGQHNIKIEFNNDNNGISSLRKYIILLEKMSKEYLNGKESKEGYDHIKGFDLISNKWFRYKNIIDYLKSYNIRYYDEDGICYKVNITNDKEMIKEILR